jgi:acetoacetate decarboxylase
MTMPGTAGGAVRYGAKPLDQLRNREIEATSVDVWATSLTVAYETDPAAIAAVLPPPLQPSDEPLVRIAIATVDVGHGYPVFGAGTFAVQAVHEGLVGNYPLLMPMTTEQAVIGGRETYGEPKKLGDVTLQIDGDQVTGWFARMGVRFVEVTGTKGAQLANPEPARRTDFYFKFLLDPAGKGFDSDPALVYCHRDEKARSLWAIDDATVTLREAPLDPVVDLPVRRLMSVQLGERSSVQTGEIRQTVSPDDILPFVHQRYDDLSVLGAPDT